MKRMLLNGVIVSALAIAAGSWLAESDSAQAAAAARHCSSSHTRGEGRSAT